MLSSGYRGVEGLPIRRRYEPEDVARSRIFRALDNGPNSCVPPSQLSYGTAGFRSNRENLSRAMYRCGILACCRSYVCHGKAVGVMITASHNPANDNGVKLVEPDGSMFPVEWEPVATAFVNADEDALSKLDPFVDITEVSNSRHGVVVVGWDTRDSSASFAKMVADGVDVLGGHVLEVGVVTTPQLHLAVKSFNRSGEYTSGTYEKGLRTGLDLFLSHGFLEQTLVKKLVVDCANGVGAIPMEALNSNLRGAAIINTPRDGPVNANCGADYVQKNRTMPTIHGAECEGELFASLDGDADRLIMYRKVSVSDSSEAIELADGDRFACLFAKFVTKHLAVANVTNIRVGVAQTAYSNGAATEYLEALEGVEVVIAKTGVKHLEKAVADYDIGIYWEPNGHGTVLFKKSGSDIISEAAHQIRSNPSKEEARKSLQILFCLSQLINQVVGDGVSNLFAVLGILTLEKMTFDDWLSLYDEKCSCNKVVRVTDKTVIVTTDFDRKVEKPIALKESIENITSGDGCRAFIRPSGTEDVVRVYAEAPAGHEEKANGIALKISRAIYDLCNGTGERL